MEASHMHMLLLEGEFSTLLSPGRASKQVYPKYCVTILRLSVLFLLSLLQVVDLKPRHWKAFLTECILSEDTDFPLWIHWSLIGNFNQHILLSRESLLYWPACIAYFLELLLPEITWSIYFVCFESVLLSVSILSIFWSCSVSILHYLSGISQVEVFQESILGIFGARLKNTYTC